MTLNNDYFINASQSNSDDSLSIKIPNLKINISMEIGNSFSPTRGSITLVFNQAYTLNDHAYDIDSFMNYDWKSKLVSINCLTHNFFVRCKNLVLTSLNFTFNDLNGLYENELCFTTNKIKAFNNEYDFLNNSEDLNDISYQNNYDDMNLLRYGSFDGFDLDEDLLDIIYAQEISPLLDEFDAIYQDNNKYEVVDWKKQGF